MFKFIKKFSQLPLSYFGMVLGLAGLSLAWRYAVSVSLLPVLFADVLSVITVLIWGVFLIGYIAKWLYYGTQAKTELQDVVLCCFASLVPITTMLIGVLAIPVSHTLAYVLIIIGTLAQLAFVAYRNAGLWRGTHQAIATTPIVYLPAVASNFVSAIAFSQLGYVSLPWLFFGAGVFSWLSIEPAILQRLRNLTPIAPERRSILGIQLAPAFVAGNAYLQLRHGEIDEVLLLLIGYGLLQLIYLVRLLPWIFAKGWSMGSWAFSFGLAAVANLGLHLVTQASTSPLVYVGWFMWSGGSLVILCIFCWTIKRFLLPNRQYH